MVAQRQQPIVIQAVVGEDHRLIIDLPPDMPTGNYTLTIYWNPDGSVIDTTDDSWLTAGRLPPGTPPTEE